MIRESEVDWTAWVLDAARLHGWRAAHFRPAKTASGEWRTAVQGDGAGFPDCVLAHPTRGVIFAELKAQGGRESLEQARWASVLMLAGAECHVWRPADRDAIMARLSGAGHQNGRDDSCGTPVPVDSRSSLG